MGLDIVELIMAVEERFGIELRNEDAETLRTPRKLIDYACARVRADDLGQCASQRSFYQVRGILGTVEKRAIRSSTPLESVLPAGDRRRLWPVLAREIGVQRELTRGLSFVATVAAATSHRVAVGAAALLGAAGGRHHAAMGQPHPPDCRRVAQEAGAAMITSPAWEG